MFFICQNFEQNTKMFVYYWSRLSSKGRVSVRGANATGGGLTPHHSLTFTFRRSLTKGSEGAPNLTSADTVLQVRQQAACVHKGDFPIASQSTQARA